MRGATFDVPQGGTNQRDGVSIPIPRSSVQAYPRPEPSYSHKTSMSNSGAGDSNSAL